MRAQFLKAFGLALAASLMAPAAASAQTNPTLVPLGRAIGALYKPDTGPAPHIAVIQSHRTGNNLNNIACREFSRRGLMALCFNTRFVNNEAAVRWEEIALDVKAAVEYARAQPGITKVVLFGHSGGSPMMTLYQAVAENGIGFCQGPGKLTQCGNELAGMKPADGLVLSDAHPGNGVNVMRDLDPSVSIVNGRLVVDPTLDPFSPANGFNPKGDSKYTKEFRDRYYAAQGRAMNELIAKAQALEARIKAGQHIFPDNDGFEVPFSEQEGAALLGALDPTTPETMRTASPRKLLKNDGSIVTQIVTTQAIGQYDNARVNRLYDGGSRHLSLKAFLSANAVRTNGNSIDGIDHCSSNNSTTCAVRYIKVPTLVQAMGAYNFIRDQEIMYETSAATDKDYIVVEGALHGYTGCRECEKTPGQYANALKNTFDYSANWIKARF